jgi:hypothetical protein
MNTQPNCFQNWILMFQISSHKLINIEENNSAKYLLGNYLSSIDYILTFGLMAWLSFSQVFIDLADKDYSSV